MPTDGIYRDGFEYRFDRFLALPGRIERRDPSILRSMFLPKLSPEAKRILRRQPNFVAGQLKHYGIEYRKPLCYDKGTNFLKTMLRDGKLNKVPEHMEKLRARMSAEWHDQLTTEEKLRIDPEGLMKKYFLDSEGRPDRTKTTEVLTIPIRSYYYANLEEKIRNAISKVSGLHYVLRKACLAYVLHMGWDRDALEIAAADYRKKDIEIQREKEDRLARLPENRHSKYVQAAQAAGARGRTDWSPIGEYVVYCPPISFRWGRYDMVMDLRGTEDPDIFEASFNFGVIEGVMILSRRMDLVDWYRAQLEAEDDSLDDEVDDGPALGSKRKAACGGDRPPKRKKSILVQPRKLFLRWKGVNTRKGKTLHAAREGFIRSRDPKFIEFYGEMDMAFVGKNVPFWAQKLSEEPGEADNSWTDFSETAVEHATRALTKALRVVAARTGAKEAVQRAKEARRGLIRLCIQEIKEILDSI
ncbi:hypothetical protein F4779DRAFT_638829 [Xylariaceae sp. FL0662B]|nr:hypothetical protein F4779DRAFT_638829 [Xylariaceae sp. FL0662B]